MLNVLILIQIRRSEKSRAPNVSDCRRPCATVKQGVAFSVTSHNPLLKGLAKTVGVSKSADLHLVAGGER